MSPAEATCVANARLAFSVSEVVEVELSLATDDDFAAASETFVREYGLAEGAGCGDAACVARRVAGELRDARRSLVAAMRRTSLSTDEPLLALTNVTVASVTPDDDDDTQYREEADRRWTPTTLGTSRRTRHSRTIHALRAVARVPEAYVAGLAAAGAEILFATGKKEPAQRAPLRQASTAFELRVVGASPGRREVYAWLDVPADRCAAGAFGRTAPTVRGPDGGVAVGFAERSWWARDGTTGAAWSAAWADDAYDGFQTGYAVNVSVGKATYGFEHVSLMSWGDATQDALRVGAFTSFGPDVEILLGGNHRADWTTSFPFPAFDPAAAALVESRRSSTNLGNFVFSKGPVTIGSDVWIGAGATILSGVAVGDGAVVGARAVVAKSVAPYSIVVGNPARHLRFRFDAATVDALLRARWWDWPDAAIVAHFADLLAPPADPATLDALADAVRRDYD